MQQKSSLCRLRVNIFYFKNSDGQTLLGICLSLSVCMFVQAFNIALKIGWASCCHYFSPTSVQIHCKHLLTVLMVARQLKVARPFTHFHQVKLISTLINPIAHLPLLLKLKPAHTQPKFQLLNLDERNKLAHLICCCQNNHSLFQAKVKD